MCNHARARVNGIRRDVFFCSNCCWEWQATIAPKIISDICFCPLLFYRLNSLSHSLSFCKWFRWLIHKPRDRAYAHLDRCSTCMADHPYLEEEKHTKYTHRLVILYTYIYIIHIRLCSFRYILFSTFIRTHIHLKVFMHHLAVNVSEYFKRKFNAIDKKKLILYQKWNKSAEWLYQQTSWNYFLNMNQQHDKKNI